MSGELDLPCSWLKGSNVRSDTKDPALRHYLLRNPLRIGWLRSFAIRDGRVYLRKTGNSARLDRRLIAEVATWLLFDLTVRLLAIGRRRRGAIWFTPDVPQAWYLVRSAARLAGIGVARSPEAARARFFFEDATVSLQPAGDGLNFGCFDISKSRVAAVFEHAAGYLLAIDPAAWRGEAVEKDEANGAHDGRIVECPCDAKPGKVYQRLIDTIDADGFATDLRTHCIGGRAVIVWVKTRPAAVRFLPPNTAVTIHPPEAIYSADELDLLARFCASMRLDWGALDVLRDRDGRIYVVDVNKTDAGPITALTLRQKLASTRVLADALAELVRRT